jgi:osmotically-inducible protein OsmY
MSWWLGYGLTRAVSDLVRREMGPQGRRDDDYILPDERARQAGCALLAAESDLDSSKIELRVLSGELTLLGSVPTAAMRVRAEQVCSAIAGIKRVANELSVA